MGYESTSEMPNATPGCRRCEQYRVLNGVQYKDIQCACEPLQKPHVAPCAQPPKKPSRFREMLRNGTMPAQASFDRTVGQRSPCDCLQAQQQLEKSKERDIKKAPPKYICINRKKRINPAYLRWQRSLRAKIEPKVGQIRTRYDKYTKRTYTEVYNGRTYEVKQNSSRSIDSYKAAIRLRSTARNVESTAYIRRVQPIITTPRYTYLNKTGRGLPSFTGYSNLPRVARQFTADTNWNNVALNTPIGGVTRATTPRARAKWEIVYNQKYDMVKRLGQQITNGYDSFPALKNASVRTDGETLLMGKNNQVTASLYFKTDYKGEPVPVFTIKNCVTNQTIVVNTDYKARQAIHATWNDPEVQAVEKGGNGPIASQNALETIKQQESVTSALRIIKAKTFSAVDAWNKGVLPPSEFNEFRLEIESALPMIQAARLRLPMVEDTVVNELDAQGDASLLAMIKEFKATDERLLFTTIPFLAYPANNDSRQEVHGLLYSQSANPEQDAILAQLLGTFESVLTDPTYVAPSRDPQPTLAEPEVAPMPTELTPEQSVLEGGPTLIPQVPNQIDKKEGNPPRLDYDDGIPPPPLIIPPEPFDNSEELPTPTLIIPPQPTLPKQPAPNTTPVPTELPTPVNPTKPEAKEATEVAANPEVIKNYLQAALNKAAAGKGLSVEVVETGEKVGDVVEAGNHITFIIRQKDSAKISVVHMFKNGDWAHSDYVPIDRPEFKFPSEANETDVQLFTARGFEGNPSNDFYIKNSNKAGVIPTNILDKIASLSNARFSKENSFEPEAAYKTLENNRNILTAQLATTFPVKDGYAIAIEEDVNNIVITNKSGKSVSIRLQEGNSSVAGAENLSNISMSQGVIAYRHPDANQLNIEFSIADLAKIKELAKSSWKLVKKEVEPAKKESVKEDDEPIDNSRISTEPNLETLVVNKVQYTPEAPKRVQLFPALQNLLQEEENVNRAELHKLISRNVYNVDLTTNGLQVTEENKNGSRLFTLSINQVPVGRLEHKANGDTYVTDNFTYQTDNQNGADIRDTSTQKRTYAERVHPLKTKVLEANNKQVMSANIAEYLQSGSYTAINGRSAKELRHIVDKGHISVDKSNAAQGVATEAVEFNTQSGSTIQLFFKPIADAVDRSEWLNGDYLAAVDYMMVNNKKIDLPLASRGSYIQMKTLLQNIDSFLVAYEQGKKQIDPQEVSTKAEPFIPPPPTDNPFSDFNSELEEEDATNEADFEIKGPPAEIKG